MSKPKLDRSIAEARIPVKAARVYSGKLRKEIAASIEHGEHPSLLLLKTWNEKRGIWEVQISISAPVHRIEEVSYATKNPATWTSIGQIVMDPQTAVKMAAELKAVATAPTDVVIPLSKYSGFEHIQCSIFTIEDEIAFWKEFWKQKKPRKRSSHK